MAFQDIGIRFVALGAGEFRREIASSRSALSGMENDIRKISNSSTALGTKFSALGSSLSRTGQMMTTQLTLPILLLEGALVGVGISFEDAFAGVAKTVDGISDDFGTLTAEGIKIRDEFRALALEIPISVNELARIGESAGQLGIAKDELTGFVETVALLGVTTDMTSEQAATFFARFGTIMGVAAEDMAEFTAQAGSTVVDLGNKFAATESEIAALSLRIVGAGQAAGLSAPEILALATAMSSLGIQSEMGGSAISRVLLEMKRAADDFTATGGEATDQLKLFAEAAGLTVDQFVALVKNSPEEALLSLLGGVNRLQESGLLTNDMLKTMNLDTIRLQDVMNRLGPNIDFVRLALKTSNDEWASGNALQIEAQKRFATTKSQIILLKNAFVDLGIEIFYLFEDNIKALIGGIKSVVTWFRKLDDGAIKTAIKFGLVVAAIGPVLTVLGTLIQLAGVAVTAFGPFGLLLPLLAPVFVLLGAVIKDVFGEPFKKATNALQDIVGWLEQAYEAGKNLAGRNVFSGISNALKQFLKIVAAGKGGLNIFSYFLRSLGMGEKDARKMGNALQTALFTPISNLVSGFEQLSFVFNEFKRDLDEFGIAEAIRQLFDPTAWGNVGNLTAFDSILLAFGATEESVQSLHDVFNSLVTDSWPKMQEVFIQVGSLLADIGNVILATVVPIVSQAVSWILTEFLPSILTLVSSIISTVRSLWDEAGPIITEIAEIVFPALEQVITQTVMPALIELVGKIGELAPIGPLIPLVIILWGGFKAITTAMWLYHAAVVATNVVMALLNSQLFLILLPLAIGAGLIYLYATNTWGFKDAIDAIHDSLWDMIAALQVIDKLGSWDKILQLTGGAMWKDITGQTTKVTTPPPQLGAVDMDTGEVVQPGGLFEQFHDFMGPYKKGVPYLIGKAAQPELFIPNESGLAVPRQDLVSMFPESGLMSAFANTQRPYIDNSTHNTNNVFSPTINGANVSSDEAVGEEVLRAYRMAVMSRG